VLRCKQSIRQILHNGLLKNYWTRMSGIFRAAVEKLVHSSVLFCQMEQAVREAAKICRRPCKCKLTFDLFTLKVVSEYVGFLCAILIFHRPLCSRLRPDVRGRQTDICQTSDVRQTSNAHHRLMPPTLIMCCVNVLVFSVAYAKVE